MRTIDAHYPPSSDADDADAAAAAAAAAAADDDDCPSFPPPTSENNIQAPDAIVLNRPVHPHPRKCVEEKMTDTCMAVLADVCYMDNLFPKRN